MFKTNNFKECNKGYTLVELLVAVAVSGIVIAGTMAGYKVFSSQYDVLNKRMEIDRQVLLVINLIQKDVAMAGYKSHRSSNTLSAADALKKSSATDFSMVFDYQEKESDPIVRHLIRYSLGPGYISDDGGALRNKIYRDLRVCNAPASGCSISTSTSKYSAGGLGEVIIDKVKNFEVKFSHTKTTGPYSGAAQIVKINLTVGTSRKVRSASGWWIDKDFTFVSRAKNVSLL